jgi:hypothetical protein
MTTKLNFQPFCPKNIKKIDFNHEILAENLENLTKNLELLGTQKPLSCSH